MKMRKVKRITAMCVILLALAGVAWAVEGMLSYDSQGQMVEPGQLHTAQDGWVTLATTASAGDEPTDLAADERTYSTVDAAITAAVGGDEKIVIYGDSGSEIRELTSWNHARFRCIGITNNATVTYQVYLGTLDGGTNCNLAYAGQLAFTLGQQASTVTGYELADTLTATASDNEKPWIRSSPGSDRVATGRIDIGGADLIVIVPTTVSCDARLLGKGC